MKLKTIAVLIFLIAILNQSCIRETKEKITPEDKKQLKETANDFMKSLKAVLVNEMQSKGIEAAVSVCSDTAQILTRNFGMDKNIVIKRVSFKNRNPENYPDINEGEILKKFEELHKQAELLPTYEHIEKVTKNGKDFILYMKPIFVQPECLSCHGKNDEIPASVKNIVRQKYNNDKAVGFSTGDLRGAVSVRKIISD